MPFTKPAAIPRHAFAITGRSGTGKTRVFRSLTEAGFRGVYATTEDKYGTVADLLTPDNFYLIQGAYFPLTASEKADPTKPVSDLVKLYDLLRTGDHPFDFLFLDSGMFYLQALLECLKRPPLNLVFPALYGEYADRAEKFWEVTRGLVSPKHPKPVDVFVTYGVERDLNWQGQRSTQIIMDGKRSKPKVEYYYDHVVYLDSRATPDGVKEYVAHTQGTDEFDAKISSPLRFPPTIVNPDFGDILRRLHEAGQNGTAAETAVLPAPATTPPTSVKDAHIDALDALDTQGAGKA